MMINLPPTANIVLKFINKHPNASLKEIANGCLDGGYMQAHYWTNQLKVHGIVSSEKWKLTKKGEKQLREKK